MTVADAESILGQILDHPNLTLSFGNHLTAREALRKLAEEARGAGTTDHGTTDQETSQ